MRHERLFVFFHVHLFLERIAMKSRVLMTAVVLLAWAALATPQVCATDYIWDGGGADALWTTPLNWTADSGYPNAATDTASLTGAVGPAISLNSTAIDLASLTFNTATAVNVGTGTLNLASGGSITKAQSRNTQNTVSVAVNLTGDATFTNRTLVAVPDGNLNISGVVTGRADNTLYITGDANEVYGAVELSADNSTTLASPIVVQNYGSLLVTNSGALGNLTAGTTLNVNSRVTMGAGINTAENFTIAGDANQVAMGSGWVMSGNVTINPGATWTVYSNPSSDPAFTGTLSGILGGSGDLKFSPSTCGVTIGGASSNTLTGTVTVQSNYSSDADNTLTLAKTGGATAIAGNLTLTRKAVVAWGGNEQIADAVVPFLDGATTKFQLNNHSETLGGITGTGIVENNAVAAGTSTLTLNVTSADAFGGVLRNNSGSGSGVLALTKQGAQTLTLSGANTYTGNTTVGAGILAVTGSLANNGSDKVLVYKDTNTTFGEAGDASITRRVANGAAYGGLGSAIANISGGELPTVADLLGTYTAGAQADVGMAWRTRTASEKSLVSEVLNLTGMHVISGTQTDTFALQMSYDPASLVAGEKPMLGWLDPGDSKWKNAVAGDIGGTPTFHDNVAWSSSMVLGDYGYYSSGSTYVAWAVVDHNGQFAVIPEPGTLALLATAFISLLAYAWRKRK